MATRTRGATLPDPRTVAVLVRASLLVLSTALAVAGEARARDLTWVLALLATGVLASLLPARDRRGWLAPVAEALVAATGIVVTGGATSPLLPYLLAPSLVAGLTLGLGAVAVVVAGAAVLLGLGASEQRPLVDYLAVGGAWLALSLAAGLVAAWVRRLLRLAGTPDEVVLTAYRLLAQLRDVVRALPGGLDPGTVGVGLLEQLRRAAAATGTPLAGGAVHLDTGDRLVPLAVVGTPPTVGPEGSAPGVEATVQPDGTLLLPLRVGTRVVGLAALPAPGAGWREELVATLRRTADAEALRLETALLFDDVRGMAISEERHRLAREIHDGIAQELVFLGYGLDAALHDAGADSPAAPGLRELRGQVTRVVSDLRMSLYDLRSEVDRQGGLGQALSEYVRTVGAGSDLTVHLSLTESPRRLSAEVEAELLRIAQEAVTDARKHARPSNLWVECEIEPPLARLRVSDDGRRDRSGPDARTIMSERAARLRATLTISDRDPVGTTVEVRLGPADTPSGDRPEEVEHGATGAAGR